MARVESHMRRIARSAFALLAAALVSAASPALAQVVLDGPLPSLSSAIVVVDPPVAVPPARPVVDRAEIRRTLAAARARHLRALRAYARAEQFPTNDMQPGMLNVVMDDAGHICAAANLMALDGNLELVRATAAADNFVRFVNVHDGAAYEWMLSSGFTQEEIDRIQEPYSFIGEMPGSLDFEDRRQQENTRVRNVLLSVARELRASTDVSLDVATDRLIAYRASHGA
jgi:hypothetical protein